MTHGETPEAVMRENAADNVVRFAPAESHALPAHKSKVPSGRKMVLVLAVAVIVALVAWAIQRRSTVSAPANAPTSAPLELASVDIVVAAPQVLSRVLPISGSLVPVVQATIKTKVGGEVEQVAVREGQDVKVGAVIARLDTRHLQAQYERELAGLEKARADLQLASLNREKNRTLLEQRFISQNTFESTEGAYAGSLASVKLAEAQARLAQMNLEDAVIRAPFAGTVAGRLVEPGEKVSADTPIVELVNLEQLFLEAAVPAADIPAIKVGQQVEFKVTGFNNRTFVGEVQRINPITVDGSRAITVYIAVANKDRTLKGGMFAQGTLNIAATEPVLSIPQTAVRQEAGATYVYTLEEGKIQRRAVKLGNTAPGAFEVEVLSGLKTGDRIIAANLGTLTVGAAATVRSEAS